MSNVSTLGNQIFINQNIPLIANRFINSHARLISQDTINSDSFEDRNKRLKDTREMEEVEAIDEHLVDDPVYSATPKYKRRERDENREEGKESPYLIDEKRKRIDIKI